MLRKTMGVVLLLAAVVHPALAQQTQKEGVAFWSKPDMEEAVRRMEVDNPTIYRYRHAIVAALWLEPGSTAADVGAGTGFVTRLMADQVGTTGTVYAQDISQESLDYNVALAREEGLSNLEPVLGDSHTTGLAESSLDLVVTIRSYHHYEHPEETVASIRRALRPDGRFVVIGPERIRGVTESKRFARVRAGKGTFTDEIVDAGFKLSREVPLFANGEFYFLVFEKR
jgi:ubiquinone/menaquinone biosynthesis C-methylase UbiE